MRFQCYLPWPPTVNGIWRRSGTRIHKSPKYEEWRQGAALSLRQASPPKMIREPVSVELRLYGPSRASYDIDNRAKAVLDLLQSEEVIEDDRLVDRLVLLRGPIHKPNGFAHLTLDRMDSGVVELPDGIAKGSTPYA